MYDIKQIHEFLLGGFWFLFGTLNGKILVLIEYLFGAMEFLMTFGHCVKKPVPRHHISLNHSLRSIAAEAAPLLGFSF